MSCSTLQVKFFLWWPFGDQLFRFSRQRIFLGPNIYIYINNLSFNNRLRINLGLRMVLFSQNNVSKRHLPFSQGYTVTYNPCQVTSTSFLQVSVFSGCQLGDYFLNQVARTKILVATAPKVVAAWRVAVISQSAFTRQEQVLARIMALFKLILGKRKFLSTCIHVQMALP